MLRPSRRVGKSSEEMTVELAWPMGWSQEGRTANTEINGEINGKFSSAKSQGDQIAETPNLLKRKNIQKRIPLASEVCTPYIDLRQSSVCVKDVNATSTVCLPKHSATRSSDTGLCGGKHLILLKLASVSHRSLSEDGWRWLECRAPYRLQRRHNRALVCIQ